MYKDILDKLNYDRRVNDSFKERLETNGFEIEYDTYSYWNNQPYIEVGKSKIWLVECYSNGNGTGCRNRYRNEVTEDIKYALEKEQKRLEEENKLIDEILPKNN